MYSLQDNYEHICGDIFYIEENNPGPTSNADPESFSILEQHNCQLTHHCECLDRCSFVRVCPCIVKFGGDNYSNHKTDSGETLKLKESKLDGPVVECNSLCGCYERGCGNRLVQYGPRQNLEIKTTNKGLGLFTNIFIPSRSFICEYAGELISKTEAMKRHSENKIKNKMNYIFCLNEHSEGRNVQTFVDPSVFGNIGRYINHSCEPNCCIVAVRVDSPLPKLAIFSKVDITAGTEITFDYGSCGADRGSDDGDKTRCLCGSEQCKGWLPCENYN